MTAREVYFEAYMTTNSMAVKLFYMKNIHVPGLKTCIPHAYCTPWLDMHPLNHEGNIRKMEEMEKRPGFLFWNIAEESEEYRKKTTAELGMDFYNVAMITKDS